MSLGKTVSVHFLRSYRVSLQEGRQRVEVQIVSNSHSTSYQTYYCTLIYSVNKPLRLPLFFSDSFFSVDSTLNLIEVVPYLFFLGSLR